MVFPGKEISDITVTLLREKADRVLQYGMTEGLTELRSELSRLAENNDGIRVDPDAILITHGSAQAMDLACRILIDPGDVVIVELPTYFGGVGAIRSCGGETTGVRVDEEGLDTEYLAAVLRGLTAQGRRVKGIYVIPNFQNPTGVTLSLKRRVRLLQLAEEYDLIIFEDDPYCDLRFEGERVPSLMVLSDSGNVIHMRSFSKIFAPGMRLGWVAAMPELVRKMAIAKQFVDCATNTLAQYILLEFIQSGLLAERIAANNRYYRGKRDFMLGQIERHFPAPVVWNRPLGGFFVFVRLPEHLDADKLLVETLEHHVAFVPGSSFFIDGSGKNTFRLSYSQASESDIEAAVIEIGRSIRSALDRATH